jgi:hypothetical protein
MLKPGEKPRANRLQRIRDRNIHIRRARKNVEEGFPLAACRRKRWMSAYFSTHAGVGYLGALLPEEE